MFFNDYNRHMFGFYALRSYQEFIDFSLALYR